MLTLLRNIIKSVSCGCIEVDRSKLDNLKYIAGPYTNPLEIKLLAYTLSQVKGDYLEIGVNIGGTAVNVCQNNPDRTIYGVDYIDGCTMHEKQAPEQPSISNVGRLCKDQPNFKLILANSWMLKLPENIGMTFIDADHSYQGVKNDTDNVLKQVRPGTVIFLHDYHNNLHPDYLRVNAFVDAELRDRFEMFEFRDTWLIGCITK